jgi:hypothetical protein
VDFSLNVVKHVKTVVCNELLLPDDFDADVQILNCALKRWLNLC